MSAIASRITRASLVVVVSTAYFAYIFRLPQDAVLTAGLGDWVDPYFINLGSVRQSAAVRSDPGGGDSRVGALVRDRQATSTLLRELAVVSAIVFVIPLRFDDFSLWKAVFAPLPGFSVIRDPGRIIPMFELAVVLLTGLLLSRLPTHSRFRVSVMALVLLLLAAPIDIDPACQSFFIKGASQEYMSRSFHMWALYGVDSMFISLDHAIPTLNGYSAWSPVGWGLANPQEPGYAEDVDRW